MMPPKFITDGAFSPPVKDKKRMTVIPHHKKSIVKFVFCCDGNAGAWMLPLIYKNIVFNFSTDPVLFSFISAEKELIFFIEKSLIILLPPAERNEIPIL